jgi:hypothetical protein
MDALASTISEIAERKGHAVDNARDALAVLDAAIADGILRPSPALTAMMDDLRLALTQEEGARLGGKSAEAARMILRAMVRELGRQ